MSYFTSPFLVSSPPLSQQLSPLIVHPKLASYVQPLFPDTKASHLPPIHRLSLFRALLPMTTFWQSCLPGAGKAWPFFTPLLFCPFAESCQPFHCCNKICRLDREHVLMDSWISYLWLEMVQWLISPFDAQLVIVPAHKAGTTHFFPVGSGMFRINPSGILEWGTSHHCLWLILTLLQALPLLTQLKKPITFLTAIMPPIPFWLSAKPWWLTHCFLGLFESLCLVQTSGITWFT